MAQLVEQLICNQLAATRSILKTNINLSFSSIYFILQSALVSMFCLIKDRRTLLLMGGEFQYGSGKHCSGG